MKKFFVLFSGILTALFLAVSAAANTTHTVSPYRDTIRDYDAVFTAMYSAMAEGAESVDLSMYKRTADEVVQIYSDLLQASPELFYADNTLTYYYNSRGIVTEVKFYYFLEADGRQEAMLQYEREVDYIASLVDPALSEAEKALFVHDYLIASYDYDTAEANYDVLSLFRERKGVCQAYSLAYIAVLRELGMDAVMVTSDEMGHAWNLVEVDGIWYHVDLSFDDPSPDRLGRVLHENFLLDDEEIRQTSTPHSGWSSSVECLSKSFSGHIWHGVTSRMIALDGQWYYIDPETMTLTVSAFDGSNRSDVYRFQERWTANAENSYYVGVFSGLSDFLGYLFINTPYEVLIFSPDTGRINVYLENTAGERLFGSRIYKNRLEYLLTDSPNGKLDHIETFEITDFREDTFGTPLPFDDILRLDPYYASVKFVYSHELFRGVSPTKFAPDAYLTRAMFVTVLGRLCRADTSLYAEVSFEDVENGQWYSPYVEWAADTGIVNGVGDNRFDPLGEITHEQMYKIVAMCGDYLEVGSLENDHPLILYDDRADISDWAFESVAYCKANGLISETFARNLYPSERATRAEAADIICKFAILCENS